MASTTARSSALQVNGDPPLGSSSIARPASVSSKSLGLHRAAASCCNSLQASPEAPVVAFGQGEEGQPSLGTARCHRHGLASVKRRQRMSAWMVNSLPLTLRAKFLAQMSRDIHHYAVACRCRWPHRCTLHRLAKSELADSP